MKITDKIIQILLGKKKKIHEISMIIIVILYHDIATMCANQFFWKSDFISSGNHFLSPINNQAKNEEWGAG